VIRSFVSKSKQSNSPRWIFDEFVSKCEPRVKENGREWNVIFTDNLEWEKGEGDTQHGPVDAKCKDALDST
jgi:hypothetical protein